MTKSRRPWEETQKNSQFSEDPCICPLHALQFPSNKKIRILRRLNEFAFLTHYHASVCSARSTYKKNYDSWKKRDHSLSVDICHPLHYKSQGKNASDPDQEFTISLWLRDLDDGRFVVRVEFWGTRRTPPASLRLRSQPDAREMKPLHRTLDAKKYT